MSQVIHDFLSDPGVQNPGAALFSMVMLSWTRKGRAYAADDYRGRLARSGLRALDLLAAEGRPSSILLAEKSPGERP